MLSVSLQSRFCVSSMYGGLQETAPIVPKGAGPRTDRLHGAEEEVLKVGGNVVRLAGLYISSSNLPVKAIVMILLFMKFVTGFCCCGLLL